MILFSIILWAVALALFIIGYLVFGGREGLIHSYHTNKVKDHGGYCKAMGKALLLLSLLLILCGVLALVLPAQWVTVAVFVCLMVGVIPIILVQKRFNGSIM
ncbi:MAG: DUF3784 domain-containing protein [Clostridiales bacterium]|nr:DUF3784 domain-containing protein [Clostridiales bacterium]